MSRDFGLRCAFEKEISTGLSANAAEAAMLTGIAGLVNGAPGGKPGSRQVFGGWDFGRAAGVRDYRR